MNPLTIAALAFGGYLVYKKMSDGTITSSMNLLSGSTQTLPPTDPAVASAVAAAQAAGVPVASVQQSTQQVAVIPPGGTQPTTQSYTVTTIGTNPGDPSQGLYLADNNAKARMMGQYRPNPPQPRPGSAVAQGVMMYGQGLEAFLAAMAQGTKTDYDGDYRMPVPAWNYYRTLWGSGLSILTEDAAGPAWNSELNQEEYFTILANPAMAAQFAGGWA